MHHEIRFLLMDEHGKEVPSTRQTVRKVLNLKYSSNNHQAHEDQQMLNLQRA